ncbi:PAS domain S-box protein [Sulfitobacter sp. CW3]|uniref:sensor histidine kinase n=1 Tax=Sulfitobacter sp. CW3 TaxID=2861965 RepID=UPI001C5E5796|nr:PAS domain-containing sensor histidine kinase [Sulfitobacter sp. CW3]MBW4960408.1 PAS domain-containing sensor histidine kinase [Sulfitobacter sp. CW3]
MSIIEKYRLAFDISPVPMLLVASDGRLLLANDDFLELFEYTIDEIQDLSVEALVPESIRAHHPELRNAYGRASTKRSMGAGRDLYGVTKSKKVIPLELGLEPVTDGVETMALVAAIDIRHRKIHEERMHRAMDAAACAMVMVDGRGTIVFVNKAASMLFGYEENDLLGHAVEMLIPEEFRRAHPVYIESFMKNSTERFMGLGRDLFARRSDGTRFPVEISLTPVEAPTGTLVMSTIVDLSERVAAAEEVAEKSAELAALNVELSHFAYSASHDLKAPLSSITGLLTLCIEDLDDGCIDDVRENLCKVIEISRRSASKVEGVLQIARAGRDGMPATEISLGTTIQEIWVDLTGGNSTAELTLDFSDQAPLVTELPTLKVIVENMLSNALRYVDAAKPKHVICVKSEPHDCGIKISISDNGIGISEQSLPKVFHMFKRLDERSGDGLGLSLVQKQVERLGGTISISSIEGEGTTISFTLPIMETACD